VTVDNNACLNHLRWHETGSYIAAGDDIGRIHLYDVAEVSINNYIQTLLSCIVNLTSPSKNVVCL